MSAFLYGCVCAVELIVWWSLGWQPSDVFIIGAFVMCILQGFIEGLEWLEKR